MQAKTFEPRGPEDVSIEFPLGRELRTSAAMDRASTGTRVLVFFIAGILLGAGALGTGYWLGNAGRTATPEPEPPGEATVEMKGVAFVPQTITVDTGTIVTWINRDAVQHTVTSDESGGPLNSGLLNQGESYSFTFTADGTYPYHCEPHAGFVGGEWTGMTGTVVVGTGQGNGPGPIDLPHSVVDARTSAPPPGWHEWNLTLVAREPPVEVAAGVPYAAWTFNGTLPAPAFRVRQGDLVNIRLVNQGTMNHSIDFHSARINWATAYRDVPAGQEHTYSFVAEYAGVFMYHCGSAPVLAHVANGMYGVMIVDPLNDTRPAADREFVLVLSEIYASDDVNDDRLYFGDSDKMLAATPTQVVFNGYAFQYHPGLGGSALPANAGERIRIYVLNAGPSIVQSFHVIGAIFDAVWIENNPTNGIAGIQTWTLPSSGGAAFDIVFPAEGLYPFVTHNFAYTGLGAVGVFAVSP